MKSGLIGIPCISKSPVCEPVQLIFAGTKTTGCKRTIPDSRTPRGEQHRVLTVQIPLDASEHNGTVSTPNDRHIPSPLPLLTPALPTPPKAPAFSSGPSNGESSTTPGASQESMYAGTSGTGGAATWSNWGDWDLRSPSWDVPRTPIPHLQTDSAPMTLGPPPEDQVLRRRNTPFDHRYYPGMVDCGSPFTARASCWDTSSARSRNRLGGVSQRKYFDIS